MGLPLTSQALSAQQRFRLGLKPHRILFTMLRSFARARRLAWASHPRPNAAALNFVQKRSLAGGVRRNERNEAKQFIIDRGYSPEISQGIVDALMSPGTGITAGTVLATVKKMAGRYEIGEDAGLEAMAKSVEIELAKTAGKKTVRFRVWGPSTAGKDWDELDKAAAKGPRGAAFVDVDGVEGMSFKDVVEHGSGDGARVLGEWIECELGWRSGCGG